MKTKTDLSIITQTFTAQELVDANITYVKGVVYECDTYDTDFVTPSRTFQGWCCDCWPLVQRGKGFALKPGFTDPVPIKETDLGEPVAVITEGFPSALKQSHMSHKRHGQ
jgi:hypothetical protein